jgi:hypothetical protein
MNKYLYQRAFENVRFVVAGKKIYRLSRDENGLWRDKHGVIWALRSDSASVDDYQGCGVHLAALPDWHIFRNLNEICARHDYMYSSPAFQFFYTRKDADEYLEALINQAEYFSVVAKPFKWLSRIFGGRFWESNKTR